MKNLTKIIFLGIFFASITGCVGYIIPAGGPYYAGINNNYQPVPICRPWYGEIICTGNYINPVPIGGIWIGGRTDSGHKNNHHFKGSRKGGLR